MANPLSALPLLQSGPKLANAQAVTILVHGRGRSPEEMLALAERLSLPEMTFLAPTAPSGTWYPESFMAPLEKNEPHLGLAIDRIAEIVDEVLSGGVARERLALVGFSQGACLIAEYIYRNPGRYGAASILTGGVIGPEGLPRANTGSFSGTPIFMGNRDADPWVPLPRTTSTAALFTEMGAAVDLMVTSGTLHVVSDAEIAATRRLLAPLVPPLVSPE